MHNYLQFRAGDGSFVLGKGGKVHKVPANDKEALRSSLMGMFEKLRARSFFIFVQNFAENDPSTYGGYNLQRMPARDLYEKFGLAAETVEFIGHALALKTNERYLDEPAIELVKAVRLYSDSMARFDRFALHLSAVRIGRASARIRSIERGARWDVHARQI